MANNKCLNCREYKNCKDSFTSWVFFIIGIIATIAVRVVTVLIDYNPLYAKIAWYIGILGFFTFFVYKFRVGQKRSKVINELGLTDKINKKEGLQESDYKVIGSILCSLSSKKERINYIFIFVLSAVALIVALLTDLTK